MTILSNLHYGNLLHTQQELRARRRATRRSKELTHGLVAAWVSLVGLAIYAGSTQAATGKVTLTKIRDADHWEVQYNDKQVEKVAFAGGILTVDATWTSLDPVEIKFVEKIIAPANDFGLRIDAAVNVTNKKDPASKAWKGFTLELAEGKAAGDSQLTEQEIIDLDFTVAAHPRAAHFHDVKTKPQKFEPFDRIGGGNAVSKIDLGGKDKKLDIDGAASWTGIGIHQWEKKGAMRDFTLRLTPVPVADEKKENSCSTLKMTDWSGSALSTGQAFPTSIVLDVPDGAQLDNVNVKVQLSATSESTLAALSLDAEQRGDIPLAWTSGPEGWVGAASLGSISGMLTAIPAFTVGAVPSDDSVTITAHVDYTCDGLSDSLEVFSTVEILPGGAVVTAE